MTAHKKTKIQLIGAPVGHGGAHLGTALGPSALRIAGIIERLELLGFDVVDSGDAVPANVEKSGSSTRINNREIVAGWSRSLSQKTHAALQDRSLPIILGGDHSISIGSINGIAKFYEEQDRELFVLWLDAHADYNTPHITPTGNMHGMSAAHLCGEAGMEDVLVSGERYSIKPKNLCLFGTRWIDPEEQLLLGQRGITVMDMRAIDKTGVAVLLQSFLDHVTACGGELHLSLDLDFLDPRIAPAVGTPEPLGFTDREGHLIMEMLHDSGLVRSIDIVELNPLLDDANKCAFLLIDLLTTLLGRKIMDIRDNSKTRDALGKVRYG